MSEYFFMSIYYDLENMSNFVVGTCRSIVYLHGSGSRVHAQYTAGLLDRLNHPWQFYKYYV